MPLPREPGHAAQPKPNDRGRHCVVREEAANDSAQPLSLFSDRLVPAPSHLSPTSMSFARIGRPGSCASAKSALDGIDRRGRDEGKPQKLECLRFYRADVEPSGRLDARFHRPHVLPFAFATASAPGTRDKNLCNGWPVCSSTDASPPPSRATARLEADVVSYSFIVSDLHRLLVAGLPAHTTTLVSTSVT